MSDIRSKFTVVLKELENSVRSGFKNGKWFPHKSVEGGTPTLAYGHKLTPEEFESGIIKLPDGTTLNWKEGVTEEEANKLLQFDIDKHMSAAEKKWNSSEEGKKKPFSALSEPQKLVLTEIEFNVKGGIKGFPNLRKAVLNNKPDEILKEISRKDLPNRVERLRSFYKPLLEEEVPTLRPEEEKLIQVLSGGSMGLPGVGSTIKELVDNAPEGEPPPITTESLTPEERKLIQSLKQAKEKPTQSPEQASESKQTGEQILSEEFVRAKERFMLAEAARKELESLKPAERKIVEALRSRPTKPELSQQDKEIEAAHNLIGELMF